MVRLLSSVISALVLSGAVLAVPTMPSYEPAPAMPEPAMPEKASTTSAAMAYESTSAAMKEPEKATSTKMMHEATTTTMMHEATTTSAAMVHETTTSAAPAETTAAKYGSGYNNWGTDLNSCVQMCQAKFGMSSGAPPPPAETQPPTSTSPGGSGATHTVIVAPTKGVLRYIPFAVNASVGDTVRFMNQNLATIQNAVDKMTLNTSAYNWASNIDASALPTEAHEELAKNVFQTRMFYAMNSGAEQGASRPDGQPISIPVEVNTLLTATAGNPGGANGAPAGAAPSGTPSTTPAAASSTPTTTTNGAKGLAASSALIAGVAVFSSLFLF
ncbi:hypothetical protein FRC07_005519 [Ceratobasidium sp. 392]|nr:hypothetical protein FRC07_005519 [Ceratobasidium sp. 392]